MPVLKQKPETVIRHLKALLKHLEDNDFSTLPQDQALKQAIEWLRVFKKPITPREPILGHEGKPTGYLHSNRDFASANMDAVIAFLEAER